MSENLPIFKASMELMVYVDTIVKNQERYYRYSIGSDLRQKVQVMLFLIHRVNRTKKSQKTEILESLVEASEEMKVLIVIAKNLKAFKSFKQFEHSSKLCVHVCKQAQAWLNSSARVSN